MPPYQAVRSKSNFHTGCKSRIFRLNSWHFSVAATEFSRERTKVSDQVPRQEAGAYLGMLALQIQFTV